jgi:branched-chain amino acid transport system substrate-binding protein
MRILIPLFASAALLVTRGLSQSAPPAGNQGPVSRELRYANMPPDAVPFREFRKPYQQWFLSPDTLAYYGPARLRSDGDRTRLDTVDIGLLGPLDSNNPDSLYGIAMLHGAQLALEEANASGGFHGTPFALKVHDDLPLWGASAMEIVKMDFNEHVWAMLGSIDSASTHIAVRATLKLEIPIVDTGTSDPTVTETRIPWLLHNFPDDRQQGYALADFIFNQKKFRRVAILRSTDRYGRKGDEVFFSAARRLGRQPLLEAKFEPSETDFSSQLRLLDTTDIDALVLWSDARQAALILKQMRDAGMKQPVFASSRVVYPELLASAGPAAEGLVAVSPLDPTRTDPRWRAFRQRFRTRFHAEPDAYASYAYDGMNILIAAIRSAGLNRGRIMDALRARQMSGYQGVGGSAFFDYTLNNIAPLTMVEVRGGRFVYSPEHRTDWDKSPSAALVPPPTHLKP